MSPLCFDLAVVREFKHNHFYLEGVFPLNIDLYGIEAFVEVGKEER